MLVKLVQFKQQNLHTETEVALYGNFTGNTFARIDEVDCSNVSLYLPQTLFDGRQFYVAKDRTSIFH